MMWKRFKKRLRSKTYHAATYIMGLGIVVDQYTPEIKQAISEKLGISWGVAYAVLFAVLMYAMREITKSPVEEKGERNDNTHPRTDGNDPKLEHDSDGRSHSSSGGMDLWADAEKRTPGTGENGDSGADQNQGSAAGDTKSRSRAQRRKRRKAGNGAHPNHQGGKRARSGVPGDRAVEGSK